MASEKRYFWLKLPEGFFRQKEIKRLRKIAGGDTYTIIYLKMLLRSLSHNGTLFFDGVENDFVSELALDIDEDEENVAVTVQFLMKQGILEEINEDEYLLKTCADMVGSEAANAERMRRHRKNLKLSQHDEVPSLCDNGVTNCDGCVITCDTEIDIEKDIDIELEKDIDIELEKDKRKKKKTPTKNTGKNNKEMAIALFNSIVPAYIISVPLIDKMREWIAYKEEKKDIYKEIGLKALLKRVQEEESNHGTVPVMNLIDECMENNWKGIIWERLTKGQGNQGNANGGKTNAGTRNDAKGYDASNYYGNAQSDFKGF